MNEIIIQSGHKTSELVLRQQQIKKRHKNDSENAERSRIADAQSVCAGNLDQEITFRCASLNRKCDITLADMGDSQILEFSNTVDKFDSELSEILDGVRSFSNFVPICGDQVRPVLYEIGNMLDEVTNVKI